MSANDLKDAIENMPYIDPELSLSAADIGSAYTELRGLALQLAALVVNEPPPTSKP